MKRSKKLLIGGIIAAVVVIGGIYKVTRPKTTYETANISKGDVVHQVSVTGSIAPFKKIALQPEVSGKIVKVSVIEGQQVKAGDVLVALNASDVGAKIASQRAVIASAQARLDELLAGSTSQELALAETALATATSKRDASIAAKSDAEKALANAQINNANAIAKADTQISGKLATFLLDYDNASTAASDAMSRLTSGIFTTNDFLTFGTINQSAEIAATSTRVDARTKLNDLSNIVSSVKISANSDAALQAYAPAIADLGGIKKHLEASRDVLSYASGVSATTLATYQQNVSTALSNINAAMQTLSVDKQSLDLQTKINAADVTASQITLQSAIAALSSATFAVDTNEKALSQGRADLNLKKGGNRPEVIASQRAQVASAVAALTGLEIDYIKRVIVAPIDGVITEVPIEVGETVQPGTVAVTMNGKGKFEIVTNVSEVDIAGVAVGQPVRITLDAFAPEQVWTGKVAFINPSEKVVEGVIFYETKIVFDNEDERLRSGMTANLAIETARRTDVLRLPLRALKQQQNRAYVQKLVGGKLMEIDVKVGVEDNEYAEVLLGLADGDDVVLGSTTK